MGDYCKLLLLLFRSMKKEFSSIFSSLNPCLYVSLLELSLCIYSSDKAARGCIRERIVVVDHLSFVFDSYFLHSYVIVCMSSGLIVLFDVRNSICFSLPCSNAGLTMLIIHAIFEVVLDVVAIIRAVGGFSLFISENYIVKKTLSPLFSKQLL